MANQIKVNHIGISVHVSYEDTSKQEPTVHSFNDTISLNFQDEADMNRALADKPYLAEVVPKLIKKLISSHDPENKLAKKILASLE